MFGRSVHRQIHRYTYFTYSGIHCKNIKHCLKPGFRRKYVAREWRDEAQLAMPLPSFSPPEFGDFCKPFKQQGKSRNNRQQYDENKHLEKYRPCWNVPACHRVAQPMCARDGAWLCIDDPVIHRPEHQCFPLLSRRVVIRTTVPWKGSMHRPPMPLGRASAPAATTKR